MAPAHLLPFVLLLCLVTPSLSQTPPLANCTESEQEIKCLITIVEEIEADTLVFDPNPHLNTDCSGAHVFCSNNSPNSTYDTYFSTDAMFRVFTKKRIDREEIVSISTTAPLPVHFHWQFFKITQQVMTLVLTINIKDLDDNVPVFYRGNQLLSDVFTMNISETTSVDLSILQLEAKDYDEGINGTNSYAILEQSVPPFFNLSIHNAGGRPSTATLVNIKELDRETNSSFTLVIGAFEGTDDPDNATVTIVINLLDTDDNEATFEVTEYNSMEYENASLNSIIVNVTAYDEDSGSFGLVVYSIMEICGFERVDSFCHIINLPQSPFHFNITTGLLTLSKPLDYESYIDYRLTITASNPVTLKPSKSTSMVRVQVLDINDNPPEVVPNSLSSVVNRSENSIVGSSIFTFQVTDADSEPYNQFNVFLIDNTTRQNSTVFNLNPSNSFFSVGLSQALNREVTDHYDLIVHAQDALDPSLFTDFPFQFIVTDVNDNKPIFASVPDPIPVNEGINSMFIILTLEATDADAGSNREVEYLIPSTGGSGNQDLFTVELLTGKIFAAGTIDRESTQSVQLLVVAQDKGSPSMSSEILLNITIQDVNDNPATITSQVPPHTTLYENEDPGHLLFTVTATDADIAPNNMITYSLINMDSSSSPIPFQISSDGRVTVNDTLDTETHAFYDLQVSVTDGVNTPETRDFTVTVQDVNDNNPVFDSLTYVKSIYENVTAGTSILQLAATDEDSPAETVFSFTLIAGHTDNHFILDPDSGILRTQVDLDRESIANYTLEAKVSDGLLSSLANAIIHVSILDVNDEIPQFTSSHYNFSINEDNALKQNVGKVTADSIEQGPNGQAYYYINAGQGIPFIIDNITGQIVANATLNRELRSSYTFTVRVEDAAPPPHFATTSVTVTVRDINNNPPVFDPNRIDLPLSERTPVGSTVHIAQATDKDLFPNDITRYTLTADNSGKFVINNETGRIVLTSSLDHETEQMVLLNIEAQDVGIEHFTNSLTINITVVPKPDIVCTFPAGFPTTYSIPEDAPLNTPLIEFHGEDHDGNQLPNLEYFLTDVTTGLPSTVFSVSIDPNTGNATIYTQALLNREDQLSYELNVTITEQANNSCVQILTVHLIDINDNSPSFVATHYAFSVQENSGIDHSFGMTIQANDPDYLNNGTVTYYLKEPSTVFNISQQQGGVGSLYVIGKIDRETEGSYDLTIVASDKGNPPMTSEAQLVVTVLDENDNYPTFSPNFLDVKETFLVGDIVARLEGSDFDEGLNGEVEFAVQAGSTSTATSKFTLYPNGSIELIDLLDFEITEEYIFFLTVSDKGSPPLLSSGNVTIRILNINDHYPIFEQTPQQLTITLLENATLNVDFITVTATDDDKGTAGNVMYRLENKADKVRFFLDPMCGQLWLISPLDYEKQTQHKVSIVAYDLGEPRNRINSTTVTINVGNVNEFLPQFDKSIYFVTIDENQDPGTFIATIIAHDGDANTDLMYTITDNVNFSYSQTTNQLTNKVPFNYETKQVHSFIIRATDGTFNGEAEVIVFVRNLNDNPPVFSPAMYTGQVSENASIGTSLLTVRARDMDSNTNLAVSYSITDGNSGNAFSVNDYTGIITVNSALDFEERSQYTLIVTAEDTGSPVKSASTTVMLTVTNYNEFRPTFTQMQYTFPVSENSPTGLSVGRVTAEDDDDGSFGVVTYSLQQDSEYFSIEPPTGIIRIKNPIDRESIPPPLLSLIVVASDVEFSSTANVLIDLMDINDNPPVFSQSNYRFPISSSYPASTPFGSVVTSDSDSPANSITNYAIQSPPLGLPVGINSSSGGLFLKQPLPSNNIWSYFFTVTATDAGNTAFTDSAIVEVYIEDNNNHPPIFPHPSYSISLNESTTLPGPLITVSAVDADTGPNGDLVYTLSPNFDNRFTINNGTGAISLVHPLDYEAGSEYSLTVTVRDSTPGNPRTASVMVQVTVLNINDNSPVVPSSTLDLSPVPYTGVTLFQTNATDLDNSVLSYTLLSYTNKFSVHPDTGVVTNTDQLLSGESYNLNIQVSDGVADVMGTVGITITASPNPPSFTSITNPLSVQEQSTPFMIQNITATGTSPINFHLVKVVPTTDIFTLVSVSEGTVTLMTTGPLDYEEFTSYEIVVEARSGDDDHRTSSFLQLNITVNNVNEAPPVFQTSDLQASIPENIAGEYTVATVEATDDDDGSFGTVTYSILNGGGDFTIDSSGVIKKPDGISLDREQKAVHNLMVVATDGGELAATVTVTVTVIDENDSPPEFLGEYSIGVIEPSEVHQFVLQVRAIDKDSGPPLVYLLGPVTSYLNGASKGSAPDTFEINSTTGQIRLLKLLDRELVDEYNITVLVTDTLHTSTAYVGVSVKDINDNPPEFTTSTFTATINELSPVGTALTQTPMVASDRDIGVNAVVRYRLVGWPEGLFSIDAVTGVIRVKQEFTYEHFSLCSDPTSSMFTGTIEATDGVHTSSAMVQVNIREINNNAPMFDNASYLINIPETAPIDEVLANVTISDQDCGTNTFITTEIPSYYTAPRRLFELMTKTPNTKYQLKVKSQLEQGIYHFKMQAFNSDPSPQNPEYYLASYAQVTVRVLPENRYSPVFNSTMYSAEVYENIETSSAVVWTLATDADAGSASEVSYSISTEGDIPFVVNTEGIVSVSGALDREKVESYSFSVVATDNGFPRRSTEVTISITILDINDNAPVFSDSPFRGSVTENVMNGTSVVIISADDFDQSSAGKVRYNLHHKFSYPFKIDSESGLITTNGDIDFETQQNYTFTVEAHDLGEPMQSNSTQVIILVLGEDEFVPKFSEDNPQTFNVNENGKKGDVIGTIRVLDQDEGSDGQVGFLLTSVNRSGYISVRNASNNVGQIILEQNSSMPVSPTKSLKKRQIEDNGRFTVEARIAVVNVNGHPSNLNTTVTVVFPSGFSASPSSTPTDIIRTPVFVGIVSVVSALGIILLAVTIVVCAVVCRTKKKGKVDISGSHLRTGLKRHNGQTMEMTQTSLGGHPSGAEEGDMSAPDLESAQHATRHRSTSDLASTVASEVLTQEPCAFSLSKAQIEAIYARNDNLLHDVSQDSVHSFNSEGGGEADGDGDIDNLMYKYELGEEGSMTHIEDEMSYDDKDKQSYSDSSRGDYTFTQSTNLWTSRPESLARSMTEMSTPGETRSSVFHTNAVYEPSQAISSYNGFSTQGSNVSLLRQRYYNSDHDLRLPPPGYNDYYPEDAPSAHPHYPSDMYSHPHPHSHTPIMSRQYEPVPMLSYGASASRGYPYAPDELPLPPTFQHHYSQPPQHYYPGHQDPTRTYEPMLSSSSTSLSTNASHPLPRSNQYTESYH